MIKILKHILLFLFLFNTSVKGQNNTDTLETYSLGKCHLKNQQVHRKLYDFPFVQLEN